MIEHEHYEELCSLAAIGEISEAELQDLRSHLTECADCRDRLFDFSQLSAQAIPLLGERYAPVAVPAGMMDRFRESARREGVTLRAPLMKSLNFSRLRIPLLGMASAAALLVAATLLGRHANYREELKRADVPVATMLASPTQNAALTSNAKSGSVAEQSDREHISAVKLADIQQLRDEMATLNRINIDSQAERDRLTAKISALSAELAKAQGDATQQTASIAQMKHQLEQRQLMDAAGLATLAENVDKIKGLQNQLSLRDAELAQSRSLLAASNEAKNLIVARNLHIIDVHDNDGSGVHKLPFGRIFYTEGKSLVFYAYDLDKSELRTTNIAFHVWGGKLGDDDSVKSLGIFRNENPNQGRWVLTCDDPHVLAKVDNIFVTAENSQKKNGAPKGKRILYAFIGGRPNHS